MLTKDASADSNKRLAAVLWALVALNAPGAAVTGALAQVIAPSAAVRLGVLPAAPFAATLSAASAFAPALAPAALPSAPLGLSAAAAAPAALPAVAAAPAAARAAAPLAPSSGASAAMSRTAAKVADALGGIGSISAAAPAGAESLGRKLQGFLSGDEAAALPGAAEAPRNAAPRPSAAAPEQTPEQRVMLRALGQVAALFTEHYAPIEWKQSQAGVDFKAGYEKIRAQVLAEPRMPQHEFQKLLAGFIASARDYHPSITFTSTEKASLPLTIVVAQGRYYIGEIDRAALPASAFPFQPGDEVVEFGGRPTAQVAAELSLVPNKAETDASLAAGELTYRSRRTGKDVPKGDVSLKIKTAAGAVRAAKLTWLYEPELVPVDVPVREGGIGPEAVSDLSAPSAPSRSEHDQVREALRHLVPLWERADAARFIAARAKPKAAESFEIAGKTSFVPPLGKLIFSLPAKIADNIPVTAAVYLDDAGRRIGYLRIPDYEGDDKVLGVISPLIAMFQKNTDALVLDQVNNPGGSVSYMNSVMSMLTDKPLQMLKHKMLIDEKDAYWAAQVLTMAKDGNLRKIMMEEFAAAEGSDPQSPGMPAVEQLIQYAKDIRSEFEAERRLTDPIYPFGLSKLAPAAVHYSKPLVVLTNELDFSAGEFLPWILQVNKRATIFGTDTAGALGAVKSVEIPNQSGIDQVSYTWTIAQGPDGKPKEGLGVKPDVRYEFTADDLRGGFAGYAKALDALIAKLVPAPSARPAAPAPPAAPRKH